MKAFGVNRPRVRVMQTTAVRSGPIRASYIPDYSIPRPGNYRKPRSPQSLDIEDAYDTPRLPSRPWWAYQIPTSDIGAPFVNPISIGLPVYWNGGDDGGNGGRGGGGGGGWGRGGGGGNGDPMKGFTYLFAVLLFVGGLYAYLKKRSEKSFLAASGVAVLLFISASLMGHPTYRNGTLLALATCIGLAGAMGYRAQQSGKIVPAGVVAALSALMSVGYVVSLV